MCDDDVVAAEVRNSDELEGFSAAARRAVGRAKTEARWLGHDRVGTEHLLLGLVADDGQDTGDASAAATALRNAGLTFPATRHKVREATAGSSRRTDDVTEPLQRTARADRALARSVRFSHERRSSVVGTEHLLLGVLDVEGTAGQVLRGLGVDVDQLRTALHATEPPLATASDDRSSSHVTQTVATPMATCPSCGALLDRVAYHLVAASGEQGARMVTVFSCRACGRFLGLAPTGTAAPDPPSA